MNAASARLNLRRPANISQVDASTAGLRLHFAAALPYVNPAAASLNAGSLRRGNNLDAAAAGFRDDHSIGMVDLDRSATSVQSNIAR